MKFNFMKQQFLLFLMLFSCSGALVAAEAGVTEDQAFVSAIQSILFLRSAEYRINMIRYIGITSDIQNVIDNYQCIIDTELPGPKPFYIPGQCKNFFENDKNISKEVEARIIKIQNSDLTSKQKVIAKSFLLAFVNRTSPSTSTQIQELFLEALIAINPKFSSVDSLGVGLSQTQKTELLKKLLEAYLANSQNDHKKIIFQALVKHGGWSVSWVTSEENALKNLSFLSRDNLMDDIYKPVFCIVVGIVMITSGVGLAINNVVKKIKASKQAATPAAEPKVDLK